jgi:putative SOS response-associated peptidase YedK
LTTDAKKLVAPYHDRMPVILPKVHYDHWLDPKDEDSEKLLPLLTPFPKSKMVSTAVNPIVNSPKNDTPECLDPPTEEAAAEQPKPRKGRQ